MSCYELWKTVLSVAAYATYVKFSCSQHINYKVWRCSIKDQLVTGSHSLFYTFASN